jgi:hypothetical protein
MIEIAIKDTDKTPVWMLPGTKVCLSFEEPGPIAIDVNKLTMDQKKTLAQDIARGVLVSKNAEELMNSTFLTSAGQNIKGHLAAKSFASPLVKVYREPDEGTYLGIEVGRKIEPAVIQEGFKEDPMKERRNFLAVELDKHVATVKKELPARSLSELRIMRDIEAHDKNRPSVLKLIDTLISKAQAEVFESLQKNYDPKAGSPVPSDLPKQYLDNVTAVVDSDHEDVTIKLGADDE